MAPLQLLIRVYYFPVKARNRPKVCRVYGNHYHGKVIRINKNIFIYCLIMVRVIQVKVYI